MWITSSPPQMTMASASAWKSSWCGVFSPDQLRMAKEPETTPSSSMALRLSAKSIGSKGALEATLRKLTLRVSSPSIKESTPVVETLPEATCSTVPRGTARWKTSLPGRRCQVSSASRRPSSAWSLPSR